jgi:hypothetical protein
LKKKFLHSNGDACSAIKAFCAAHKCSILFHTKDEKQFYSQINCEEYGQDKLYSAPLLHVFFDMENYLFLPLAHVSELRGDGVNYALSHAASTYLGKSMWSFLSFVTDL